MSQECILMCNFKPCEGASLLFCSTWTCPWCNRTFRSRDEFAAAGCHRDLYNVGNRFWSLHITRLPSTCWYLIPCKWDIARYYLLYHGIRHYIKHIVLIVMVIQTCICIFCMSKYVNFFLLAYMPQRPSQRGKRCRLLRGTSYHV